MRGFIGEMLGTFILTLFGCSSVAVAVLFGEYNSIFQIGLVWGVGVTLAIFLTRNICCAHLNPAVSVAMVVAGRMKAKQLPSYLSAQFVGAILAGGMLYVLFSPSIAQYELVHNITRGTAASVDTARMFGEFYPNPGDAMATVSLPLAMLAEGFGTMLLALFIFALTEDCNVGRPSSDLQPLFIGLTVSSIIFFIAPLTQAGSKGGLFGGTAITAYAAGGTEVTQANVICQQYSYMDANPNSFHAPSPSPAGMAVPIKLGNIFFARESIIRNNSVKR